MKVQEYLEKMKNTQNLLLDYIDAEENIQKKFENLIIILKNIENKHQLTSTIHLITSIIDYHYRSNNFFEKIFKIILFLKDAIKKNYSNSEIFWFFKNNEKIIVFLSEEKIINLDEFESIGISLYAEKGRFIDLKSIPKERPLLSNTPSEYVDIPQNIKEFREKGYDYDYFLELIQKDLIDEFIFEINRTNKNLECTFYPRKPLDTNIFLIKSFKVSLIEYSAFFGSVQIFKYLIMNGCTLNPKIWLFAIHGCNYEIIHILEDKNIQPEDKSFKTCLKFAIICHHNELANYILNKYIEDDDIDAYILKQSLKSYNFSFIQLESMNSNVFLDLCKRDYYYFAKEILQSNNDIDINMKIIRKGLYQGDPIVKEKTALFCAIEKGNYEIVQLLLECKEIDVNKKSNLDRCEFTPLYVAALNGNDKIVESLLNCKNIDINMKSYFSQELTPLSAAIKYNEINVARLLIERNDININLKSLLLYEDDEDLSFYMYKEVTPLFQAVENDRNEIVSLLLDHKDIDINIKAIVKSAQYLTYCNEETVLYHVVSFNQTDILRLFLSRNMIDFNSEENDLLSFAVKYRCDDIVQMLLENKNIDINDKLIEPNLKNNGEDE